MQDVVRQLGYLTLGSRLKRLGERLQVQTQRVLEAHGLAVQAGQAPFLAAIDRLGPSTIGQLADAVGVSQPGATRTLGQLAEAGFVTIETSPQDQRRKSVGLSRKGRRLIESGKRDAWPLLEAAVRQVCETAEGTLLEQLATIEDELAATPLDRRAEEIHADATRRARAAEGSAR